MGADQTESAIRRPKRTRRPLRWALIGLAVVVGLALIVVGTYAGITWKSLGSVQRSELLPPDESRPAATAAAFGSLNYLLMGSDSRGGGDQGRSDVLMVAHIPPSHDKVYLISFPRDLWVTVPGRGAAKINAAYAWGGPTLTAATVESLVGVRMDHAAEIDFEGFVGLTTALGGVTVTNKVASSSGKFKWPTGRITISGAEALAYVRQRYELPNGDLDRAERQRAVVTAILAKLMSRGLLTDPVRFNAVMGELGSFITVDKALTNEALFTTATSMKVSGASDIHSLQAPITGFGRSADGQSIDILDKAKMAELATAIQTGTMADYMAKYPQ